MKIKYLRAFLPSLALVLFTACNSDNDTTTPGIEDPAPTAIIHNGTTYGTVTSPYTGKVWLDRNLGAARVCESFNDTACYGDYYQWGRNFDGHEDSISAITIVQAKDVTTVGHGDFIKESFDWASVDGTGATRTANWSKTDGSSVCPVGFRVPTITELREDTLGNGITNRDTAFANFLKLPSAGDRGYFGGFMGGVGVWGVVWSSSVDAVDESFALNITFGDEVAYWNSDNRANGFSVRCLRD